MRNNDQLILPGMENRNDFLLKESRVWPQATRDDEPQTVQPPAAPLAESSQIQLPLI